MIPSLNSEIIEVHTLHKATADKMEPALKVLTAGVDIELPDPACYIHIKKLIAKKKITSGSVNRTIYDFNMSYSVEPGEFEIQTGTYSLDKDIKKAILTVE